MKQSTLLHTLFTVIHLVNGLPASSLEIVYPIMILPSHLKTEVVPTTETIDPAALGPRGDHAVLSGSRGSLPEPNEKRSDPYQFTEATVYPYRVTGQLQIVPNIGCSGALVGPDLVLTARHCAVAGDQGSTNGGIQFYPDYDNGPNGFLGGANVTHKYLPKVPTSNTDACSPQEDWAILKIDRRLGDALGYLGVGFASKSKLNQPIFSTVGYHGNRDNFQRPYRQDNIVLSSTFPQFDCSSTGPIRSTDQAGPGSSGAALWIAGGDFSIIWGVVSSTVNIVDGNGHIIQSYTQHAAGQSLVNSVRYLRAASG